MIVLSILAIIISCVVSSLIHKCEKVDDILLAYPNDTVLAPSELTECQSNASVSLVEIQNQVQIYVVNCSSMNISTEYHEVDFHLINTTEGYSIIDVSHPSGSNYYAQKTTVEVNVSSTTSGVFFCLFNSKDYDSFQHFLTTDDEDVFHHIILQQPTCQELGVNDTAIQYTINTTDYYYGGISSLDVIQSINITLSIVRRFFHVSDDMETCALFDMTQTCPVNQVYPDTCILVNSIPLNMNHINFSYINIRADKVPESFFVLETILPFSFGSVVLSMLFIVAIFMCWCILCVKCCDRRRNNTYVA